MPKNLIPKPPQSLSEASQGLWKGLFSDLKALGRGSEVDCLILADLLQARDRLQSVSEKISEDGVTVTGSRGNTRPHPLLAAEAQLRREISLGFAKLGLADLPLHVAVTPSGRLKQGEDY